MNDKQFAERVDKLLDPVLMECGRKYLEGKRPAYLCLPFEGNVEAYAAKVGRIARMVEDRGYAVMAPYLALMDPRVDADSDFEFVKDGVMRMIEYCDEFWVTRDMVTANVIAELSRAVKIGKQIRYVMEIREEEKNE